MITCRYCHATTRQIKVGKTQTGLQIYGCLHCNRKYSSEAKRRDHPDSAIALATETYAGGDDSQAVVSALHPTPVRGNARILSKTAQTKITRNKWGWLPEIALLESLGLLILAWTFMRTRATDESAQLFWWIGLALLILPVAFRVASIEASRRERIALVLLLGMSLYFVKIMHSPLAFTFPDELSHVRNVSEIFESHRLFQENPIQPVTAYYPGLPTVTSTLSSLSGLSLFSSGLLVVGVARLILFLALYLLFEQVSGSVRVAGLGTVVYMANPNFLYWTAEYAYEPLALPFLIFVLLMVAKKEMSKDRTRSGAWTVAAVLGVLTVVITHHMTSYILTGLLVAITVLSMIHSRGKKTGPWQLTLVALFGTSIWLILVANLTINYLSPVLSGAVDSVFKMIADEETGRALFTSSNGPIESASTPIWEQLVAFGAVIVIALGLPLGALEIWKRHRNKVFAILLGTIALAYLPVQMLRFTSAGWETANRSSEFLFIGIGFVLAVGLVRFWLSQWTGWTSKAVLAGLSVIIFFGGLIAGWPPRARLARPYIVDTGSYLVRPQVVTVAEWMLEYLGPDNRLAASKADAKVLGAYGQYPFTGNGPIRDMFLAERFGDAQRTTLLKRDIRYIVSDRKNVSWDHMIGYYFYNRQSTRASDLRLIEQRIFEKLNGVRGITRLLDSGDIVIYDVEMHLAAYKNSEDTTELEPEAISRIITLPEISATPGPSTEEGKDLTGSLGPSAISTPSLGETLSTANTLPSPTSLPVLRCMGDTIPLGDKRLGLSMGTDRVSDGATQIKCFTWSWP